MRSGPLDVGIADAAPSSSSPTLLVGEDFVLTAADSLVGFWREIERQGKTPTVAQCLRFCRALGFSITNAEAYRLLEKFSAFRRRDHGEITESQISTNGEAAERSRRDHGEPSRARDKVSLVPNPSLVFANANTGTEAQRKPEPRKRDDDINAYFLLDACFKALLALKPDLAMDRVTWRTRNKGAAVSLLLAGKTVEQCVERLRLAHTGPRREFYGGIVMLAKLQEHWTNILPQASVGSRVAEKYMPVDPAITPEQRQANVKRLAEMTAALTTEKTLENACSVA